MFSIVNKVFIFWVVIKNKSKQQLKIMNVGVTKGLYIQVTQFDFPSFAHSHELELDNDDDTKLVCEDMEISVEDDERTITMVEDVVSVSQMSLPALQPLAAEEEDIDDKIVV